MAGYEVDVAPKGDWINHEDSDLCVCGPLPRFVDGGTVRVHQALDDRLKGPISGAILAGMVQKAEAAIAAKVAADREDEDGETDQRA